MKTLLLLSVLGLMTWSYFDRLPEDYCDTTHEFDNYQAHGVVGQYWPGNDYLVKERRKICKAAYQFCGGQRVCTKLETFGYLKF